MSISTKTADSSSRTLRWTLILGFAALAFFASYRFAVASTSTSTSTVSTASTASTGSPLVAAPGTAGSPAAASGAAPTAPVAGGGGCCGGGAAAGPKTTKKADTTGSVQKISVDLSKGYYDPSTIELKAGVPAEITFGQGSGCMSQVQSPELNFYEDLTSGPKTVKIAALQPGTYTFTCGMQMVSGTIVVK